MTPLLEYDGDYSSDKRARSGQRIYKIGIKLGESKHLTTAGCVHIVRGLGSSADD